MPKERERSVNPVAAHRKAEKQRALKTGKAVVAAQRNERLAQRNPSRLQRQIDELKEIETGGGSLSLRDRKTLEELERDLGRIRKAKDAIGDKYVAPQRNDGRQQYRDRGRGHSLGKRSRGDGNWKEQTRDGERESNSSETDESVRNIPMPRDTPPPIPPNRRRGSHGLAKGANSIPLGERSSGTMDGTAKPHALPQKPVAPVATTVYEAKPEIRNLQKEAVAFVPSAVRRNFDSTKGNVSGRLLEEEELQRLESQGYGQNIMKEKTASKAMIGGEEYEDSSNEDLKAIDEEEAKWREDFKQPQVEDADDSNG